MRGTFLAGPDISVGLALEMKKVLREGGRMPRPQESVVVGDLMIISQCCDIGDPRVLVANVVDATSAQIGRLSHTQQEAVRRGDLTAEPLRAGEPPPLVLPGIYYLADLAGVVERRSVVWFSSIRGVRREDLLRLDKRAELTAQSRRQLRRRLANYFGRVAEEDLPLLNQE